MQVKIVVGGQWGDEAKGKITDILAQDVDVIGRYQGGQNAGHTVIHKGKIHALHAVPSGIFHPYVINVIGNGCVSDLTKLRKELKLLADDGIDVSNLRISKQAHILTAYHQALDAYTEHLRGKENIGTTMTGIGPGYSDKAMKYGIRFEDFEKPEIARKKFLTRLSYPEVQAALEFTGTKIDEKYFDEQITLFNDIINHGVSLVNLPYFYRDMEDELRRDVKVIAEGAQGTFLDVDYGTYPFSTSSNSGAPGAFSGLGLPANAIVTDVIGIFKAYNTRVGSGPFPTELGDKESLSRKYGMASNEFNELHRKVINGVANNAEIGCYLRAVGCEQGATTGRPRRTGWHDFFMDEFAVLYNGITSLAITKLDVLDEVPAIKYCIGHELNKTRLKELSPTDDMWNVTPVYESVPGWLTKTSDIRQYDDLPANTKAYLEEAQKRTGRPINFISVGPGPEHTIIRK